MNVKHKLLFSGECDGFLVMVDAELRMMIFFATMNEHFGASVAGLEIVDAACGVIIIGGLELRFVVIDKADGFVVADELDAF